MTSTDIDTVSMTIYQPRRQNVSSYEVSKDDLYQWADEVLKPTADLALAGESETSYVVNGADSVKQSMNAELERKPIFYSHSTILSYRHCWRIRKSKSSSPVSTNWSLAGDIKEYALQQAISGKEWTGWKLVEGRSNRRYTSEDAVSKAVKAAGFDPYEKKLLGITAMQKLLGKPRFEEILAAYIEKPQGKPTLVPESDKRPAMNTAKNDFMEEYDNE